MTETGQTDYIQNLIRFMVILTVLATIVTLVLYFWTIVPIQNMEKQDTPSNYWIDTETGKTCYTSSIDNCVKKQELFCTFEYGYDTWNGFWCRAGAPVGCFWYPRDEYCK